MTSRQPRPARNNPFLAHALDGWEREDGPVRYPVTFSVHTEGPLLGLYLSPVDLGSLHAALDLPGDDRALVRQGRGDRVVPWSRAGLLRPDVELVHLPAGIDLAALDLPEPLLAAPHRAVPAGSRVALALHDACHAAVYSPDREVLGRVLLGFLADYQVTVVGRPVHVPELPPPLLHALLEPRPTGAFTRVRLRPGRRYWVLELHHGLGDGGAVGERWVSEGEGGRWRAGWAW